jgi:DNA-binding PadR family transcriptional regulator
MYTPIVGVYIADHEAIVSPSYIGEFEQMVLLGLLQCRDEPYAPQIRRVLEERASRTVSRGALYRTLDRLAGKGYLEWELEDSSPVPERGGHPMRRFRVTEAGRDALRVSRTALLSLWDGVESEVERA